MTRTRQATAAFVIAAVGMVAAPCYAQRGERRHGPGNGGGQHAQARGGGREAQPQTQRDVPRRESRQAAQATPRGGYRQQPQARSFQQPQSRSFQQPQARSFQQPQSRGRSGGRESWQPQSQPRGNFRQPVEPPDLCGGQPAVRPSLDGPHGPIAVQGVSVSQWRSPGFAPVAGVAGVRRACGASS